MTLKNKLIQVCSACWLVVFISGCAHHEFRQAPEGQKSFAEYVEQTRQWIAENRHFATEDHQQEINRHTPFELRPPYPTDKGILLIHGLGDSPWSFHDIAPQLAAQGYLVRTVLLPGHGTKPADMIGVTGQDWYTAVQEQIQLLKKEVPHVWLGGFSTGGNIAVTEASKDKDIKGVVLFSPAVKIRTKLVELVPIADVFMTWLIKPDDKTQGVTPFKYSIVPMDALYAFKQTMDDADKALSENKFDKPSIVMLSEKDSIVNTQALLPLFDKQYTNKDSRIIWYGNKPAGKKLSGRVLQKTAFLPELRIESFSHMSLPFSPKNEWYGKDGKYRYCVIRSQKGYYELCEKAPVVWYGAYGTKDGDKVFARLTYNPYFFEQAKEIVKVLGKGTPYYIPNKIYEKIEPVKVNNGS